MNKRTAKSDSGSLQPPFVHYSVGNQADRLGSMVTMVFPALKLFEFDGSELEDLSLFANTMRQSLTSFVYYPSGAPEHLFWCHFRDVLSTGVDVGDHAGCVLIFKNAYNVLRSVPDGLLALGGAMHEASDACANPMRYYSSYTSRQVIEPQSPHNTALWAHTK
ncbi:MAG: hypothetical protein GY789_22925 [Hyphomicrobiales bacterium]|nr:hypothetical protein [Hyphomicrobiales bacterium]MCP5000400.1 hypothetical protein [Hyphomicrobiales bacterium]